MEGISPMSGVAHVLSEQQPVHQRNPRGHPNTTKPATDLQQTQVLQTILNQLLYPALLRLILVLAERVSRLAAGVVAEVVVGELGRLAQQRAELYEVGYRVSYLI